jgi:hypothetical protein
MDNAVVQNRKLFDIHIVHPYRMVRQGVDCAPFRRSESHLGIISKICMACVSSHEACGACFAPFDAVRLHRLPCTTFGLWDFSNEQFNVLKSSLGEPRRGTRSVCAASHEHTFWLSRSLQLLIWAYCTVKPCTRQTSPIPDGGLDAYLLYDTI